MNKKFIKLAEKAGFCFWKDEEWGPGEGHIDWSPNYDKEFVEYSELLVRKCIEICEKGTETQTTSAGAASLIRQHFKIKD